MGKTLITLDNIDEFVCCGKLAMDSSKIITAGARDELTRRGIEVVYGEAEGQCCCHEQAHAPHEAQYDEELLVGVAAIIRQHYGITDPETLKKVTLETVAAIGKDLH
jgi:hypothetical protein